MPAIYHRERRVVHLDLIRAGDANGWFLGLYTTNITPNETYVLATYSPLATYSGYTPVALTFPAASLDANGDAVTVNVNITFSHNGGATANTIYGWIVYHASQSKVIFAELLAGPKTMAASGDTITIGLTLRLTEAP